LLRLFLGSNFRYRELPTDGVIEQVRSGRAEAGMVCQAEPANRLEGLRVLVDLGEWWLLETGLPLPLGVKVARRDLGAEPLRELSKVLGDSIAVSLESREKAFPHALKRRRWLEGRAQDYGDEGRQAVRELLERSQRVGAFDSVRIEFVA
jgi:1,4-dihydroxy-6-naphthoate synthase